MSSDTPLNDWNPEAYDRFRGLRLRPALDLLAQVPDLPEGDVVDLGCGSGAVGGPLGTRFPDHPLRGLDRSAAMLEEAEASGHYTSLEACEIEQWRATQPVALIFSNAVLNWLPDHATLLPRLFEQLTPGGVLAVQVPNQQLAPSHTLLRQISADMFPDRFDWSQWRDNVRNMAEYAEDLDALGRLTLWETGYAQKLPAAESGHPVRHFTQSTGARPILAKLTAAETDRFFNAYDEALEHAYPRRADGSVLFPFRRLFFTLLRPDPTGDALKHP